MNFDKFTQKSIDALQSAQRLAMEQNNQAVTQLHMLSALIEQENGLVPSLLLKMGVQKDALNAALTQEIAGLPKISGAGTANIYIAPELERALNEAFQAAGSMKDEYVSVEHIMLGIIDAPEDKLKKLFKSFGIDKPGFLQALSSVRGGKRVTNDSPEDTYDALNKYAKDLVQLARQQKLDPVIGRDSEIMNVVRILSRKTKNNPVLIGEPGVGKTAIAEGLAQRIVAGDVPASLKDRSIFSLDMGSLIAGA